MLPHWTALPSYYGDDETTSSSPQSMWSHAVDAHPDKPITKPWQRKHHSHANHLHHYHYYHHHRLSHPRQPWSSLWLVKITQSRTWENSHHSSVAFSRYLTRWNRVDKCQFFLAILQFPPPNYYFTTWHFLHRVRHLSTSVPLQKDPALVVFVVVCSLRLLGWHSICTKFV